MAHELSLADHPVLDPDILSGTHLLEADAGTGKTWTIAHLVLRAVVERDIGIGNIAVLTFTNAAAAELRERIADLFDRWLNEGVADDDPFRQQWQPAVAPELVHKRLRLARLQLEDAAIETIHGFCQRILHENALSLGRWDRPEAGPSDDQALLEATAQWWRDNIINGSPAVAQLCDVQGLSLARLRAVLAQALSDPQAEIICAADLAADPIVDLTELPEHLLRAVQALRAVWRQEQSAFVDWLHSTDFCLKRNIYRADSIADIADDLNRFLEAYPASVAGGCDMLNFLDPHRIRYACRKGFDVGQVLARFDSFQAAQRLLTLLRQRADLSAIVARQIRHEIAARVQDIQRRAGVIAFDDLLHHTRDALAHPVLGNRLATQLRSRYRLAFVDEFQDTDPAQWEIFRRIYRPGEYFPELPTGSEPDPDADIVTAEQASPTFACGLILVGDPKQAIYSFRNADIKTYLSAARLELTRHRLAHNHRSNRQLIESVNALHGREQPFVNAEIGFTNTLAGIRADAKDNQAPDDALGALTIVQLDEQGGAESRSSDLAAQAAAVCASEIKFLLDSGRAVAGDIAVLVPTGARGTLVSDALSEHGIDAVEIGRQTVFTSTEAADLFRVVTAIASPSSPDLVRGALTTQLIGYDLSGIAQLADEPTQWQDVLRALADASRRWQSMGPQAALRQLLFGDLNRAASLAAMQQGERRLTNVLHLLSLLAEESSASANAAQGQIWLGRQIRYARENRDNEEALVRLENDDKLVTVMTVHASKGLQFPIVFLPFAWQVPAGRSSPYPVYRIAAADSDARLLAAASRPTWYYKQHPATDSFKAPARIAAFEESIRLNYVALTRAQRRCYVFWAKDPNSHGPVALAWLLDRQLQAAQIADIGTPKFRASLQAVEQRISELATSCSGLTVVTRSELLDRALSSTTKLTAAGTRSRQLVLQPFDQKVAVDWTVRSFTSLSAGGAGQAAPITVRPDHDQLQAGTLVESSNRANDDSLPIAMSFPRGANPGTCLHEILENADFSKPVDQRQVLRRLRRYAIDADPDAVAKWMNQVLRSALPGDDSHDSNATFRLCEIASGDTVRELSYTLAVDGLKPATISRLIAPHFPVPTLDGAGWSGFLNGFIDLLVRVRGRYWLIDWKSNWLGSGSDDYGPAGLAEAMASHGYTLQMSLYSLAVHRMLRARISGYQYETHFGGVHYLFLRAMRGDDSGCGVFSARLPAALIDQLDRAFGGPINV